MQHYRRLAFAAVWGISERDALQLHVSAHGLQLLCLGRIRQLIVDHPLAEESTCQVRFNNFAESSLDILVIFNLMVEDYASELREREAVLLQIMDLVKDAGVEFAFPTRTLYIENGTGDSAARPVPDRLVSAFAGRS